MEYIKYTVVGNTYSSPQQVFFDNANTIQFINKGTSNVIIDELSLNLGPDESFTVYGNLGEVCISNYSLNFKAVGGENNNCLVITKQYA